MTVPCRFTRLFALHHVCKHEHRELARRIP